MDRIDEILFLYEDDVVEMKDGGRIGFDNGGKTSKIKTSEFQYPVKFKNRNTGEIETVYKKEPIDYEARGKRVSTKVDTYKTALDDFQKQVDDAIQSKDVSKLPKNFAQFLKDKGLKSGTYFALLDNNQIPKIETDTSKIRLNFANNLIKEANQGFKFINAETLFKDAGFTPKEYKSLYATKQLRRLDKAEDKVAKGFRALISPQTNSPYYVKGGSPKVVDVFNPTQKIAELTGLNQSIVSKRIDSLNIKKEAPEIFKVYRILGNPNFKKNISANFPDTTITQLMMAPKSFFADYAQSKAAGVRKERLTKARAKAGKGVVDILEGQEEAIELLNKFYKENPNELLNNTKLRNVLDLTLKDGEIVKKNKYVKDKDFLELIKNKAGLFTKDHVDEVQFEKLSTEFPVFRQLATYNTNSGLIKSIKAYVSKNQNSKDPVVQNKIKKQIKFLEDLKLRVDTPTGRVGSKEVLAAVDRKAGTLPNFLAQLRALNIKLPPKAKAAILGISGGLGATTLAAAGPIEETGTKSILPEVAGGAAAGSLAFKPVRKAVGKGLKATGRVLGKLAVPIGLGAEAYFAKQAYDEGKSIPEIMAAPFLLDSKVRQTQDMLSMKPEERQAINRQMIEDDISGLSSDFETPRKEGVDEVDIVEVLKRVQKKRMADEARRREERAGGGIAGIRRPNAIPPESGPNSQGLENLKYYVTNT